MHASVISIALFVCGIRFGYAGDIFTASSTPRYALLGMLPNVTLTLSEAKGKGPGVGGIGDSSLRSE